jgi:hypothetical protein
MSANVVNEPNRWRLETPGHADWARSARPGDAKKYLMISADSHVNEPQSLWRDRIDAKYKDRLPRVITDEKGVQWRIHVRRHTHACRQANRSPRGGARWGRLSVRTIVLHPDAPRMRRRRADTRRTVG